jgi:hypothetical protein
MKNFEWSPVSEKPPIKRTKSIQSVSDTLWLYSKEFGVIQGNAYVMNVDFNASHEPREKNEIWYAALNMRQLTDVTHWMPVEIPVKPVLTISKTATKKAEK